MKRKLVLGVALCLVVTGCGLLGSGSPAQDVEPGAGLVAPTLATVVDVEATRRAEDLEEKRKEDAALLARSSVSGGAVPAGVMPGERQSTARAVLSATLEGQGREGPGRGDEVWSAWWYRPGHGDFTTSEVYARHLESDLFPVKAECGGEAVHPWGADNGYLYYELYEAVSQLRGDWGMSWEKFRELSADRLAWELQPDPGLRLRIWVDLAVMESDGEAFYVLGAVADGRRKAVELEGGQVVECPHWVGIERSSVILVRLD